jgi:predicted transcriptional regulator
MSNKPSQADGLKGVNVATREHIHHLIETLPEDDLDAVEEFVERLCSTIDDPFARAHLRAAMLEPETLSIEDEAAIAEAEADFAAGRIVSHEEVQRRIRHADG